MEEDRRCVCGVHVVQGPLKFRLILLMRVAEHSYYTAFVIFIHAFSFHQTLQDNDEVCALVMEYYTSRFHDTAIT
jgi:hypothetical protein